MVSLFLRTNQLTFLILNSIVAVIYYPNFLTSLVLLSNIQKLKYSILTGHMDSSTLPN